MPEKKSVEAVPVSTTSLNVPPSVRAALAAAKSEVELEVPKTGFRTWRVRTQLLIIYGLLTIFTFGVLVGICAFVTQRVETSVVDTARTELMDQITNNSKLVVRETGSVLDMRLSDGVSVLVQPSAFALFEVLAGTSTLTRARRRTMILPPTGPA